MALAPGSNSRAMSPPERGSSFVRSGSFTARVPGALALGCFLFAVTAAPAARTSEKDSDCASLIAQALGGDEAAFLGSIAATADDPTPRLVFADWLDESGRAASAEAMRIGVELWHDVSEERRRQQETRRADIERAAVLEWNRSVVGRALASVGTFTRLDPDGLPMFSFFWNRDLPEHLAALPSKALHLVVGVSAAHARIESAAWRSVVESDLPNVLSLRLENLQFGDDRAIGARSMEALLRATFLRRLHHLSVNSVAMPARSIPRLFAGGRLGQLRTLDVWGWHGNSGDVLARALTASPAWKTLRRLRLAAARLGPSGVAALAGAGGAPALRELDLSQNELGDGGVALLVPAPWFSRVRRLDLFSTSVTGVGLAALAASPVARTLENLRLAHNAIAAEGIEAFVDSRAFVRLADLDLNHCGLDDAAMARLSRRRGWRSLRRLSLADNDIGTAGVTALAESFVLAHVQKLGLSQNRRLGAEGVVALAASPRVSNLRELFLSATAVGDDGVKALARSPYLRRLASLDVSWSGVGDGGLVDLAHSSRLPSLEVLDARGPAGERAAVALASAPRLPRLRTLRLWPADGEISEAATRALMEARNLGPLESLELSPTRRYSRAEWDAENDALPR